MQTPTGTNPTELDQVQQGRARVAKRPLSAVLLSIAAHGGVFALVVVLGAAVKTSVVEPTTWQVLARLEVAGGPHAVKISAPVMDYGAHTKHPDPTPEASKTTI